MKLFPKKVSSDTVINITGVNPNDIGASDNSSSTGSCGKIVASIGDTRGGGGESNNNRINKKILSSSTRSEDDVSSSGSLPKHPKVRALQLFRWDHSVYSLSIARSAFGASVVRHVPSADSDQCTVSRDVVLIAGGRGTTSQKCGTSLPSVLDSIEVFDPTMSTKAQLLQHQLNVARYSSGAFTVAPNIMCILGGKDRNNTYLSSVELVSDTSARILGDKFSLPVPMACFGVATISAKVYLFGGKSKECTLTDIYETDISYFVDAHEGGTAYSIFPSSIWKKVGDLMSTIGPAPRHSFSLVVEGDVCWLIGGFDGKKLLKSVGLYHTKYNIFMFHPKCLAVERSGLTTFSLGKCIGVVGGTASKTKHASSENKISDSTSQTTAVSELLLRFDGETKTTNCKDEDFVAVPNLDLPQQDQGVYQIGYTLYGIGQYNFYAEEPTCTISSMSLVDLPETFNVEHKIDGIVVAKEFPLPDVPREPAEPKLSQDVETLTYSVGEWKKLIEKMKKEYIINVDDAVFTSQIIHDKLVESWTQEIAKANHTLIDAKPEMNSKIEGLRLDFERRKQKLEQETEEQIRLQKKDFEAQSMRCNGQVEKLEKLIEEYGNRLRQHKHSLQTNLITWVHAKNLDVKNMEGIVAGAMPGPRNLEGADLSADRRKIVSVFSGLNVEPVVVSKEYGRHCTNNYDVKNQIGVGGFGSVYRGNDLKLRRTFAFKRVTLMADNPQKLEAALKTFEREISTLKRVRHPNIVALYGYYMEPGSDNSVLVYEFLDRGSLVEFLKNEDGRVQLPYLRRLRIMSETIRALNFLHTGGCAGLEIQHRDIKPHNICLAEDWSSKLIDCGLARIERVEEPISDRSGTYFHSTNNLVGTDGYICRAYWNGMRPYVSACDIYSFGILMVELITGAVNLQNKKFPGDIYNHFKFSLSGAAVKDGLSKLIDRCDELVVWNANDLSTLSNLALQCLSFDVNERPTAKTLVYEINRILLRSEIGELVEEFTNNDTSNSKALPCSVCNEHRDHFIECKNKHTLCHQCITQEAVMASNVGNETLKCPIMECQCTFDIKKDLYALVPQDVYNKATSEGRILEYLERIDKKQNRVVSEISMVRKGVNRGLQAMASLTTSGNSPCPKLVWIIPGASIAVSATSPSTWVKGLTDVPVLVYFICEHSFTPVTKPILITVKRKWLRHVAPALKVTLFVLKLTTALAGLPLPVSNLGNLAEQVNVAAEYVDSLLESAQCNLINQSESLFTDGVRAFDNEQLKLLTGRAYDLIADGVRSTGGQWSWQDELKPVLNENGATIWVKNDHISRYNLSNTHPNA